MAVTIWVIVAALAKLNTWLPLAPLISTVVLVVMAAAGPATSASVAAKVTVTTPVREAAPPSLAPLTFRSTRPAPLTPVWKSSEPSSSFMPWKLVWLDRRLMLLTMLSTWTWLASISSLVRPPELADCPTRPSNWTNMLEISFRPPSAVPTTLVARSALDMADWMEALSARRFSLAIRPAGSSEAVLIRKPVLRRWRVLLRLALFWLNTVEASKAVTLVLMLLM